MRPHQIHCRHVTAQLHSPLPPFNQYRQKNPGRPFKIPKSSRPRTRRGFRTPLVGSRPIQPFFSFFLPSSCKPRRNQQERPGIATHQPVKSHSNRTSHQHPHSVLQGHSIQTQYKKMSNPRLRNSCQKSCRESVDPAINICKDVRTVGWLATIVV